MFHLSAKTSDDLSDVILEATTKDKKIRFETKELGVKFETSKLETQKIYHFEVVANYTGIIKEISFR